MRVGPLGRRPLVVGTISKPVLHADALDDQHAVLHLHVAFTLRREPALTGVDPARLQRATQGPGQSTGGRGHHVIERGGVRL